VRIQCQRRDVVQPDVDEKENQRDLYRVEKEADVHALGLLVAIQQDGHRKKGFLHVEHEADERQVGRLNAYGHLVVRPPDVRQSPHADPDSPPGSRTRGPTFENSLKPRSTRMSQ
jgi:hypothetical protein